MRTRGFVIVAAGATAALALPLRSATPSCPPSPYRSKRTLVIAHASGSYFGPPNTVEMLQAAMNAGADFVDIDVRVTADGVPVASHDDTIRAGSERHSIALSTLQQVQMLDVGRDWAGPKGSYPYRTSGVAVRVPTVEAVLRAFPSTRVSIEFKVTGGERRTCDLLRSLKRTGDVYVSSDGDAAINNFKPLCPEVTTTVTDALVPVLLAAREDGRRFCAPVPIGQPPLRFGPRRLTKDNVAWEQAHGLAVFTWTANDLATLRYVKTLGVDAIYTDRADLASQVFTQT